MSIVEYRKVKCDECGKEVTIKEAGYSIPFGWYELGITLGKKSHGQGVYDKELCSKKCILKHANNLKKIPDRVAYI